MRITLDTKLNAGSCSFCDRTNYRKVYVLKSDAASNGSTIVRVCKKCLKEIKSKI